MIAFLFSPIGRYVAIGLLVFVVLGGVYAKIRADAVAEIEAAAQADVLRRTQNALTAGDAVGTSPDKLREPDGNLRN
jgi:high-affinity K+ transport system ATPase subunit B